MGVMDRFLNVMRLNEEDDDDFLDDDFLDDEEDFEEEEVVKAPKKSRFARKAKPVEPEVDDFLDDDDDEVIEQPKSTPVRFTTAKPKPQPVKAAAPIRPVATPTPVKKKDAVMEVCVIKPISVEDAREITETLLDNRTVVLNLEGLDLEIGQRIIDFTSGACFAMDGNLQKISNFIFIATPSNVDISGDFLNMMGSFNSSALQTDM